MPAAAAGVHLTGWKAYDRPPGAQGFLRSWQASGFCDKVVQRIDEIVTGLKGKGGNVRVFVTGMQHFAEVVHPHFVNACTRIC